MLYEEAPSPGVITMSLRISLGVETEVVDHLTIAADLIICYRKTTKVNNFEQSM